MRSMNRELQIEKFLPTVGFEPGTFSFWSERGKRWSIRADIYGAPECDRVLSECSIKSYPTHVLDVDDLSCIIVSFCCLTY